MTNKKQITISVEKDIDYYISDILCWLRGYLAGRGGEYDHLLNPAIEKIRELNIELEEKLKEEEPDYKHTYTYPK